MPQRFGDFATWTGSVGTVAAFGIAFFQLHKERGHRLARELEDRLLIKREHAKRVTAWIDDSELTVANLSGHPIHHLEISYSRDDEDGKETVGAKVLNFVLPGQTSLPLPAGTVSQIPAMAFTDARGHRWRREVGKPPTLQPEA